MLYSALYWFVCDTKIFIFVFNFLFHIHVLLIHNNSKIYIYKGHKCSSKQKYIYYFIAVLIIHIHSSLILIILHCLHSTHLKIKQFMQRKNNQLLKKVYNNVFLLHYILPFSKDNRSVFWWNGINMIMLWHDLFFFVVNVLLSK